MKLLSIINRVHILALLIVLVAWTGVLYFVLQWEVYDNIDEVLAFRKGRLIKEIIQDGAVPPNSRYHDFVIDRMVDLPVEHGDSFQDTLLFKNGRSYDEYRRITSYFEFKGAVYRLRMILPHLEQDELVDTLAYTLPALAIMILVTLSVASSQLNKFAWKPFYHILDQFRLYRIDKQNALEFNPTSIKEFKELQQGVKDLTARSTAMYLQQKQFTENASHEIQTPLAIMHSKIELLFQQPLSRKQASLLNDLYAATTRLSKINETLLLLARIENEQFSDKSSVNVQSVVTEVMPYFEEYIAQHDITTTVDIKPDEQVFANSTLFSILITNLLKNAFIHNRVHGRVGIRAENNTITVTNTGSDTEMPVGRIFDRFFTQAAPGKGGLGLGLAIVRSICEVNNWRVAYRQEKTIHEVAIQY